MNVASSSKRPSSSCAVSKNAAAQISANVAERNICEGDEGNNTGKENNDNATPGKRKRSTKGKGSKAKPRKTSRKKKEDVSEDEAFDAEALDDDSEEEAVEENSKKSSKSKSSKRKKLGEWAGWICPPILGGGRKITKDDFAKELADLDAFIAEGKAKKDALL